MFARLMLVVELILFITVGVSLFQYSSPPKTDEIEQVRAYTRQLEFDYINWTIDAAITKIQAGSVGLPSTLERGSQKMAVADYLNLTQTALEKESLLAQVYADPGIADKDTGTQALQADLESIYEQQKGLAPLVEAVLQEQVSQVLVELGLSSGGQPLPLVLYHTSALPQALIVSRRDKIEQIANISVKTDLSLNEQVDLEDSVDDGLNVSSLVVSIGGVGVYPTMVMRTTDLRWLVETITHEWTHNYLTLRPLGILYDATPELRTMNETAASIAGTEIGALILARYYPELIQPGTASIGPTSFVNEHLLPIYTPPQGFDFRKEMHTTRVKTDALLEQGRINEAESYMEMRRQVFLQNGYLIRKLNQAYFSFYGSYADEPGGPAGKDPVGPAVRSLRAQSTSLDDFLWRISWMTDFGQLQEAVK